MKTIHLRVDVKVPSDHHDWQLYDLLGVDIVAEEMTNLLMAAVNRFRMELEGTSYSKETAKKALRETWKWLDNELDKFSNFGSSDTEPVGVAAHYLSCLCSLVAFGRRDGFDDVGLG